MKILKQIPVFLLAALMVCAANVSFAQEQNPNKNNEKQQPKPKIAFENIKSMKVAFFTEKLSLTAEEAEKFWPVYNECEKEAYEARRETMKAQRELTKMVSEKSESTESEIIKQIDAYFACMNRENALSKEHFAKFNKVLPIKKAAKIRILEEQFFHNLVGQMKKEPERKPNNNGKKVRVLHLKKDNKE